MSLIPIAQKVVAQDTELKRAIAASASETLALTSALTQLKQELASALLQAQKLVTQNSTIATGTIGTAIAVTLADLTANLTAAEVAFITENDTAYYQIDLMPFRKRLNIVTPDLAPVVNRLGLDPVFVFSMNRITNEPGAVLQIDRDSDRAILELSYVGNNIDLASLQTFIGSSGASVSKIYDKSGNNNHAVQSNKARQPRIAENGTIYTANGKPTLRFNNSSIVAPAPMSNLAELDLFVVHREISRRESVIFDLSGDNDTSRGLAHLPWSNGVAYFDIGSPYINGSDRIFGLYPVQIGNLAIIEFNNSTISDAKEIVVNSATIADGTKSANPPVCTKFEIGSGIQPGFDGNFSEIILFDRRLNSADRTALTTDRSVFYAIGI